MQALQANSPAAQQQQLSTAAEANRPDPWQHAGTASIHPSTTAAGQHSTAEEANLTKSLTECGHCKHIHPSTTAAGEHSAAADADLTDP